MNSIGFRDDCMHLINAYCEHKSTDFQLFCDEWKQNGFHYVFTGYSLQHELVVSTEYYFTSLMNIFSSLTSVEERVAALYLMYSLYFKQPTKDFCKFRLTLSEWQNMKTFYDRIHADSRYLQACAIFWRLWQSNAFRLVGCEMEQYVQLIQNNRNNAEAPRFHKINSEINGTLRSLRDGDKGLVCAIETLQVGYNEMKDHFKTNFGECSSLRSVNVLKDIDCQLNNIQKNFANDDGQLSAQSYLLDMLGNYSELSTDYEMSDEKETFSKMDTQKFGDGLNIGSKRALLREKAMNQASNEIHCLKSRTKELSFQDSQMERTRSLPYHFENNICIKIEPTSGNVDKSGNVTISYPKKIYNRHNGSSVERQMIDYPP